MRYRPILFNGPMVRAILDGRKTQTRRIIKPQPEFTGSSVPGMEDCYNYTWRGWYGDADHFERDCAPYQPGDRLWVRETWRAWIPPESENLNWGWRVRYQVDMEERDPNASWDDNCPYDPDELGLDVEPTRWRPSIHMPRWASRITLEVTGVRVERLQSISECDAQAEGVSAVSWWDMESIPNAELAKGIPRQDHLSYRAGLCRLWSDTYGQNAWDANPWVWVYEFRRVEGGISQCNTRRD